MRTGACVINSRGETLSAVSWIDGNQIFVKLTIVDDESAMDITLDGNTALVFASELKGVVPGAEIVSSGAN